MRSISLRPYVATEGKVKLTLDGLHEDINEAHSPAEILPILRAAQERLVPLVGRAKAEEIVQIFINERNLKHEQRN